MVANLLLATFFDVPTFLIRAVGLIVLTYVITFLLAHPLFDSSHAEKVAAMAALAFGMFVLLCIVMAIWALGMLAVGAFADFETAFYFSTSAFATIGFTDVASARQWRLFASLEGVTGFLVMGWSAAYLVTSSIRFGPFERDKHF
jgi:hypothetical protein